MGEVIQNLWLIHTIPMMTSSSTSTTTPRLSRRNLTSTNESDDTNPFRFRERMITMRHFALFICSFTIAAPVPRDLPPPEVTPGDYQTLWNNSPWSYTLSADGTCTGSAGACCYVGIWSWDPKRRELMLCETNNEWQSWRCYIFAVDKDLKGRCIESANTGEPDDTPCGVTWTLKR